jgi:hypothetical protein
VSATSLTAFDITVMFQKLSEVTPGQPAVLDQVAVSFSPQQFKALVRSLGETLKGYESVFGELAIPDADTAPFKTAEQISESIAAGRREAQEAKAADASSTAKKPHS